MLRKSPVLPLLVLLLVFGCSCTKKSEIHVDRIRVVTGAEQCAPAHCDFEHPLRIELLGTQTPGIFGGKGARPPVVNKLVKAVPAPGSDLKVSPQIISSDEGGGATFTVSAGSKLGDQYLQIIPLDAPDRAVSVRYAVGIAVSGNNQEYSAGEVSAPLKATITDGFGNPMPGAPVRFELLASCEGIKPTSEILNPVTVTDGDGVASTRVKIGQKTGAYDVGVNVIWPDGEAISCNKRIRLFGLDLVKVVVAVFGGLAFFVFGMSMMADGIQKIAGENMRKLLQFFSRNGIVAVLAGAVVTAVIQSSSATTVMVIGFISAGLLNLTQAIGIIFGATIGTTMTAQIIAFNLTELALPAITIGLIITFFRPRVVKGWGETILGFGMLFFGMAMMSTELKALGELPAFVSFFHTFDCQPHSVGGFMPFGAVLGAIGIGALATMIIQSSSATLGIILALASSGLVNFYTAVPLLVGAHIGTTITAMLASLTANRVAKQAALAHTLFSVFGALVMLILFYIPYGQERTPIFLYFINAITPGNVFDAIPQNIERHIAMAHTLSATAAVLLMLPFIEQFAKLCNWLLPVNEKNKLEINLLEPKVLSTPSVALRQTVTAIHEMVNAAWSMTDRAVNGNFLAGKIDEAEAERLNRDEELIDQMQADVTAYLVQITRRELTEHQSNLVPLLMHCTNDAERIADHTEIILQLTERLAKSGKPLSSSGDTDLKKMWKLLDDQAHNVLEALGSDDPAKVKFALKDERKVNKLAKKLEEQHTDRLRKEKCDLANAVVFIEMLGELAKIGDHLTNIAERTPEMQKHYIEL